MFISLLLTSLFQHQFLLGSLFIFSLTFFLFVSLISQSIFILRIYLSLVLIFILILLGFTLFTCSFPLSLYLSFLAFLLHFVTHFHSCVLTILNFALNLYSCLCRFLSPLVLFFLPCGTLTPLLSLLLFRYSPLPIMDSLLQNVTHSVLPFSPFRPWDLLVRFSLQAPAK